MDIYNLAVEVTRRCNLKCEHCLRGEPQPLKIKPEFLRDFLKTVNSISSLTITGGEPSLPSGCDGIEMVLDALDYYNTYVGSFYMATNGVRISTRFVDLCKRLYYRCGDNEISMIHISNDKFHSNCSGKNFNWIPDKFVEMEYELGVGEGVLVGRKYSGMLPYSGLINEGRCNFGGREVPSDFLQWVEYGDGDGESKDFRIDSGVVYLNCKGNVIQGCDFSYKSQDSSEVILCSASEFGEKIIRLKCEKAD